MSIFSYLRSHVVVSTVVVIAAACIGVIAGRVATQKAPPPNTGGVAQVTLVNAATFRQGNLSVSANGVVESHSQADLKSQISAPVVSIKVAIGDPVYAGQTILELQNADIRAQLAQAQASLALAQGQFVTGAYSLDSAKQGAIDKIRDAYIKTYDAIVSQAEPILYNVNGNGSQLSSFSIDTVLNSRMTETDTDLQKGLRTWKIAGDALLVSTSTDKIEAAFILAQQNMIKADSLLSDISKVLNNLGIYATPSFAASLATWKATVSAARASVSGAGQALTAAEMALHTGASSQGSTAQAQISLAQAGVDNLQAQLAKTIIRAPSAGKVSALPLREGELASPATHLATVIGGDSGLEVKAYVSGEDLSQVKVGAAVTIQRQTSQNESAVSTSTIRGRVSNIAPSIDAVTRKAEVDIDISDPTHAGLVIGQNVSASIARSVSTQGTAQQSVYLVPIQDVKVVPGAAYVFTVDGDSKIKRNDVMLGDIQGDFVQVTGGLTDDMNIVTPVYELDEGQKVEVR